MIYRSLFHPTSVTISKVSKVDCVRVHAVGSSMLKTAGGRE